ncbi:MAG: DUF4115 domain-containing protein [Candidatus Doudnabacteria bacterium]|nr:DUF4115 domain-containing protein [Candidatus Doudnabacteria bacterium]
MQFGRFAMALFKAKKVKIETLGEYLLHARESLNFSLLEVRKLTQIPEKYLESMERGDFARLPADVYVKGFLKRISSLYRVSEEVLLTQFAKERGVERSLKQEQLAPVSVSSSLFPKILITPKLLGVIGILLLVAVSIVYLLLQVRSVSSAPVLNLTFPQTTTVINSSSILLRGQAEPGSRVLVNDSEIPVDENGEFREIINLSEGSNTLVVRAENKFGRTTTVERTVVVRFGQSAAPSTPTNSSMEKLQVVVVVGPEDAWILADSDGQVVFDGVIPAGTGKTFEAEKKLLLTTGNAGSTRVNFNGTDLGVLGQPGEVLSNIEFSR